MNNTSAKVFAFLAYLLNIVGALYVLFARRKDEFAVHHAKQSLGITIIAIGLFVFWIVFGWIISWIPYIGFIFAIATFSLVIAAYIALAVGYITGIIYVLDEKMQPVPVVGKFATRLSSMIFR
jgi:uncharacterized membrane protein